MRLASTPALAAKFGTTVGGFGIAFVALAFGGIAGTRAAPPLIARFGAGRTTVIGGFAIAVLLAARAAPSAIGWFVAAQVLAGVADGVQDVAMNVVAVGVDAQARRPIVNRLHAVWSIGAVTGGLIGAALAAADASVTAHFLVAAATVAGLNLTTLGLVHLPRAAAPPVLVAGRVRWWHSRTLVALAAMEIAASVLEGAPLDWGTLYLTDVLHAGIGGRGRRDRHLHGRHGRRPPGRRSPGAPVRRSRRTAVRRGRRGRHVDHRARRRSGRGRPRRLVRDRRRRRDGVPRALRRRGPLAAGLPPGVGIGAVSGVARVGFLLGPALIGAIADGWNLRVAMTVPAIAALFIVALADAARRPSAPVTDTAPA